MQKMEIKLDEERIRADGKDINKMWADIDKAFEEGQCIKEVQKDGSVVYYGNPNRTNYLSDFGVAFVQLSYKKWFAYYALKCMWYDNDDDETLPFQEMNSLIEMKKEFGF